MLTRKNLEDNFSGLYDLGDGIFRCEDVLPKSTFFYYVMLGRDVGNARDILLLSANEADDDFALFIFHNQPGEIRNSPFDIFELPSNKRNFSNLAFVREDCHEYFKGRLDKEREKLTFCFPVHKFEFTGSESREEFSILRKETIPILDWARQPSPKIMLRFDNPRTKSGTGNSDVFVKFELLEREIRNLSGVTNGFIEIANYKGQVVEVLSPSEESFVLIRNRDDNDRQNLRSKELLKVVFDFLTH